MRRILFCIAAVLISLNILAQSSVELKLNPEKNKVYRLKAVSEQTVNQTINGNQQTVDTRSVYILSLKMIDATTDFIIAELHFDTLSTKTNSMGKVINMTSANEGNIKSSDMGDVMSCIMNRLSKNAIYAKIDYTGKPLEIVNSKMLSGLVLKDTSSISLTGPAAAAVKTQVAGMVSDDNLKTLIGMFISNLPGKNVSAGESWNNTQQTKSGGMMLDIITSYHLDGIKENSADITAESVIKPSPNALPIESAGAKVTYDNLQGLSKSDMVIDTRTGLVTKSSSKTHISGNLGITAPGFSMQMPMDINGEASVTSID